MIRIITAKRLRSLEIDLRLSQEEVAYFKAAASRADSEVKTLTERNAMLAKSAKNIGQLLVANMIAAKRTKRKLFASDLAQALKKTVHVDQHPDGGVTLILADMPVSPPEKDPPATSTPPAPA
jgi:hypothetical protein